MPLGWCSRMDRLAGIFWVRGRGRRSSVRDLLCSVVQGDKCKKQGPSLQTVFKCARYSLNIRRNVDLHTM